MLGTNCPNDGKSTETHRLNYLGDGFLLEVHGDGNCALYAVLALLEGEKTYESDDSTRRLLVEH